MQMSHTRKSQLVAEQLLALMGHVAQGSEPRAMALAADLDLSMSQMRALIALWRAREPVSLGTLAREVALSDAAAGRMIDHLVRTELVVRREDEHDRRIKRISLSPSGAEAVAGLIAAKREELEQLSDSLLPQELDQLAQALDPIVTRLGLTVEPEPPYLSSTTDRS